MTLGALREQLLAEGLLGADHPGWGDEQGSAWYITFLVGAGAWLAAILLLCVLGILGLLDNEGSALALSLTGLAGACLVRYRAAGEFLRQLCLAVLLAGEALLLYGLSDIDSRLVWGLCACVVLALPLGGFVDRAGRILTALMMGIVVLVMAWGEPVLPPDLFAFGLAFVAGFCWLRQVPLLAGPFARVQAPLGYASLITLFALLQLSYWNWLEARYVGPATTALLTCAVLWMVARLQRDLRLPLGAGLASLVAVVLLGAVSWGVPGLIAGVGALILGFAARDAVVQGMAWIYLLVFGTTFYYELSLTLLQKSLVLVLSGALFLVLWRMVKNA